MADNMLQKLIESISFKASIKLKIGEDGQNGKYIRFLRIDCDDKEVVKECLGQIEEYLLHTDYVNEINKELEKLEYYTSTNGSTITHFISQDSYNSCPLVRLLHIRELLIRAFSYNCRGISPKGETGSWYKLNCNNSINLTSFFGTTPQRVATIEKEMKNELNQRLALSDTNYFAFTISNGVFSEPYILKISNGKIQEVICSTSGHTSTNLHSYLQEFIKNNNLACKIIRTLPLKHDGDCTRYADYALIQFQYLSEVHGADKAFSLLNKNKPYEVDKKIFRDFQMFSYFCGYDLIKKRMYPLPEGIVTEMVSKSSPKGSQANASTLHKETPLPPKKNSTEEKKESKRQRKQEISEFIMWINKLKGKRDELHQRYPQYSVDDTSNAYGVVSQLINTLDTCVQQYKEQKINLEEFKKYSSIEIQNKRSGVLSKHRGIKEILTNLLLAIGTLGIGYALGALFTQRLNPIKCNTDSANLLHEGINYIHAEVF